MERKEYKLFKTKKKIAKENNLVPAKKDPDIFYDFSLLDTINFKEDYEREMLQNDIIHYTEISWYSEPMPTIIIYDNFTCYVGQIRTAYRRIYNKSGKRIMVIVELTKVHIEKQTRPDVWTQIMKTEYEYNAEVYRHGDQGDVEVA